MAIDVSQIHNLVRTYQRALHDSAEHPSTPKSSAHTQEDTVSVSAEARTRVERSPHEAGRPTPT